jgi:hypothetical protein
VFIEMKIGSVAGKSGRSGLVKGIGLQYNERQGAPCDPIAGQPFANAEELCLAPAIRCILQFKIRREGEQVILARAGTAMNAPVCNAPNMALST